MPRFEDEPEVGAQAFILIGSGHQRDHENTWIGPCFVDELFKREGIRCWRIEYPDGTSGVIPESCVDLWVSAGQVRKAADWEKPQR